jgi:hypothetical protein
MVMKMAFSTSLKQASRLADVVGFEGAVYLSAWFGQRQIYVPTTASDDHLLQKVIGEQAFSKLVKEHGGEYLDVPPIEAPAMRQAGLVHRLTAKGVSAADVAHVTGICPRSVRLIRKQLRLEGFPQLAELLPDGL